MSNKKAEQLKQIDPFSVALLDDRQDAFEWLNLCNEATAEIEQHLRLIQHDVADLMPSSCLQMVQRIQDHCLQTFRMEKTLQDEIEHQESESSASSDAAAAA